MYMYMWVLSGFEIRCILMTELFETTTVTVTVTVIVCGWVV